MSQEAEGNNPNPQENAIPQEPTAPQPERVTRRQAIRRGGGGGGLIALYILGKVTGVLPRSWWPTELSPVLPATPTPDKKVTPDTAWAHQPIKSDVLTLKEPNSSAQISVPPDAITFAYYQTKLGNVYMRLMCNPGNEVVSQEIPNDTENGLQGTKITLESYRPIGSPNDSWRTLILENKSRLQSQLAYPQNSKIEVAVVQAGPVNSSTELFLKTFQNMDAITPAGLQ